jgi:hypothetical protein
MTHSELNELIRTAHTLSDDELLMAFEQVGIIADFNTCSLSMEEYNLIKAVYFLLDSMCKNRELITNIEV